MDSHVNISEQIAATGDQAQKFATAYKARIATVKRDNEAYDEAVAQSMSAARVLAEIMNEAPEYLRPILIAHMLESALDFRGM
jgi:hypothetical protein